MKAQEYLDTLIEECRIFDEKSSEYKNVYAKLFPNVTDVKAEILKMDNEQLYDYFKSSQAMLDIQVVFTKLANFLYFCKHIDIELDLTKIQEIGNLANFISNFIPFNTEFITTSEGELKEKKSKEFDKKFEIFKSSVDKVTNLV